MLIDVLRGIDILIELAREHIIRRRVNVQIELHQKLVYLIVVYGVVEIGKAGTLRNGFKPFGKAAYIRGVVVFLNMLARPCDSHAVQDLKEVKVKHTQKRCGCAGFWRLLAPCGKHTLGAAEYLVNRMGRVKLFVYHGGFAFIGKLKLIA